MSWCEATPQTPATIELAQFLRRRHVPVRTWRGKRCADCGFAWRRHGCRQYLWATDYLSRLSRIVLADRPSRPKCGRHRPAYTEKLRDYAAVAEEHIAIQTRLRHQRRSVGRGPASPARIHQQHTTHRPAAASVPARSAAPVPASRPAPRPGALSAPHPGRRRLGPETARNAAPEAPAPIPPPAAVSTPHPSRRILGSEAARNATTEAPAPAPTFAARNRTQYPSARFAQAAAPAPKPEPVSTPAPRPSVRGVAATEPDRVGAPVSWQLYR